MTSKEKLKLLYLNAVLHNDDPNFIMEQTSYLEDLIKDLEILEILKRVFNYKSIQKFIEDMSKEEWFKIEEWLEK